MAGLSTTGFETKRLPTILDELETSLKNELGVDIDVSSDSLLGILNSIYGAAISDQWAVAQAVYAAFNINAAEGKQLDDLVALVGISRLSASPTNGNITFKGNQGTTVPTGTVVADNVGNTYSTTEDILLTITSCVRTEIKVSNVADSNLYTIVIEGDSYDYTSSVGATQQSIIEGLRALIGTQTDYTATKNTAGDTLIITSNTTLSTIALTISADLTVNKVTSVGNVENNVAGAIQALSNSITSVSTPVSGLDSVNNPVALTIGREEETDEELRVRHTESVQIAGTATVTAIQSSLASIQGVTQALVVENRGTTTDGEGRPAKSYECVVEGGNEDDIGAKIWETKPAGVETYGDILNIVTDVNGNSQAVYFSRPEPSYIWVEVDYTLYDEESFPLDGEDSIKQAIVDYAEALDLGDDVIPKRFFGSIYSAVSGIEDLVIRIASSGTDPNTEPSGGSFLEDPIDITSTQIAKLDIDRITVTAV